MRRWKIWTGILLASLVAVPAGQSFADDEEPAKLLGRCTADDLEEEPYSEWFSEEYGDYDPNSAVMNRLRRIDTKDVVITVFFGTWCGDSRREVPRLLNLLDELEFPAERLHLVAVDHVDEAHKQSPAHEEKGMEIYRVPTMVVSRDGTEIARMVEYPVLSLERDLLAILEGEPYAPDYSSYPVIRRWLEEGLLSDENISPWGLAGQVRQQVRSEGELAAAGRVFLSRGDVKEAVMLFRVNCALYPRSSRCFARLANGLQELGNAVEAREVAERALRLNTDPGRVKELVALIEPAQD